MTQHVYVVEDHQSFSKFVTFTLAKQHFLVTPLDGGADLLRLMHEKPADLVLLDRNLPDIDGYRLCAELKLEFPHIPVLMFSVAGENDDVVKGLQIGADDYLPKPFSPEMLLAKIEAVQRRYRLFDVGVPKPEQIGQGPLVIEPASRQVFLDGEPMPCTKSEYEILVSLLERPGVALARTEVLHKALGYPEDADYGESNLAFHITALRKKLGRHRELIETVRGFGYRIKQMTGSSK